MTDGSSLTAVSATKPFAPRRETAMIVYDSVQLQTVIDCLEAAHRPATALAACVGKNTDATPPEVIELRVAVGRAVAAVMSFQPRRKEL
jgi:hypothetical protein